MSLWTLLCAHPADIYPGSVFHSVLLVKNYGPGAAVTFILGQATGCEPFVRLLLPMEVNEASPDLTHIAVS